MEYPWDELQIAETTDVREVRRAYARRIKLVHPEDDPEGFQRLREAYDLATFLASINVSEEVGAEAANDSVAVTPPPAPPVRPQAYDFAPRVFESYKNFQAAGAVETLRAILRSPEMENIELRIQFEQLLADELARQYSLEFPLIETIANELKWKASIETDYTVQNLIDRLAAWQAYRDLLRTRDATKEPLQSLAARMLTTPFEGNRFRLNLILHPGLAGAVQSRLAELQVQSPLVVGEFLDAKTVEWWASRRRLPVTAILWAVGILAALVVFALNNGFAWLLLVAGGLFVLALIVGVIAGLSHAAKSDIVPLRRAAILIVCVFFFVAIVYGITENQRVLRVILIVGAMGAIARGLGSLLKGKF